MRHHVFARRFAVPVVAVRQGPTPAGFLWPPGGVALPRLETMCVSFSPQSRGVSSGSPHATHHTTTTKATAHSALNNDNGEEPVPQRVVDVTIVGAGISGLVAARRLREAGLSVAVLDKSSRVGGLWSGRGLYECLRLQQHKNVFAFDGAPWPSETPEYPTARDVRVRVNAFADGHGLRDVVQLRKAVTRVRRCEDSGLWLTTYVDGGLSSSAAHDMPSSPLVTKFPPDLATPEGTAAAAASGNKQTTTTRSSSSVSNNNNNNNDDDDKNKCDSLPSASTITLASRRVALACGSLGSPFVPSSLAASLEGFQGSVVHSASYYRPQAYANKRVVVIGWGASSVEIAADLATRGECESVTLVAPPRKDAKTGHAYEDWCLSRDIGPDATSQFCADQDRATSLKERNARVRDAMLKRHPSALDNLPAALRPRGEPLDGRIIVSEAFHDALDARRLTVVAGSIQGVDPHGKALLVAEVAASSSDDDDDGDFSPNRTIRAVAADDLVLCTGYEPPLPRFARILEPNVVPSSIDLYRTMWSPDAPQTLSFLGLGFGFVSIAKLADVQARLLVAHVAGDLTLPKASEMRSWVDAVKRTNLMGSTQCLTDDAFLADIAFDVSPSSRSSPKNKPVSSSATTRAQRQRPTSRNPASFFGGGEAPSTLRQKPLSPRAPPQQQQQQQQQTQRLFSSAAAGAGAPPPQSGGGIQKRVYLSTQAVEDDDDEKELPLRASLSAIGDAINSTGFKSGDPRASYAAWAETYDDDSFDVLKFDSPYACRDHLLAYWPTAEDKTTTTGYPRVTKVLDVGCGTGAVARLVLEQLSEPERVLTEFHGLDLTPEMLAVAARAGRYSTLTNWSVSDAPWPAESDAFDLAACNGVLLYVDPAFRVLSEFVRVVKPGGHAVLMIRDDNVDAWRPHIDRLERERKWRLVEVSESRDNFPGQRDLDDDVKDDSSDDGADASKPITYRMYVLQILERANYSNAAAT